MMQQDLVRPEPTKEDIKTNLQKYSPFYHQAMHFDKAEVQTLFYVAHNNFSSEKALKKLEAFGLFEDKKIVFVEFRGAKRGPVSDAVVEGDAEGVSDQPRRNSSHFSVIVKEKGSYASKELEISADGKCGIVSSIVALNEITRGDTPPSPEVLLRDETVVSGPPQNGDIVQSDSNDSFDSLLKKIYKPKVVKDEEGKDKYEDDVILHHCVRDNLTSESPEFQPIFGSLSLQLKKRVEKLLTESQESDWLEPKYVHEILTANIDVKRLISQGQLQNISAGNIFSFQAAIPATVVAEDFHCHASADEEHLPLSPEVSSAPNPFNQTLTRAGLPNEGMELEPDKTLKHEFRIIVLNILHEWIKDHECVFSKIDDNDFLKDLIAKKLGSGYADKIQTAFGGDKITFKSLLAIEEDLSSQVAFSTTLYTQADYPTTLTSIPEELNENQTEQLEKEREAFYSAQCSFDVSENQNNKVWGRIKDIVDKYNSTEVFQTTNPDFNASFNGALKKIKEIPTVDKGSIDSTILGFNDKVKKITEVAQADTSAELLGKILSAQPDFPGHDDARLAPAQTDQAQPDSAQPATDQTATDEVEEDEDFIDSIYVMEVDEVIENHIDLKTPPSLHESVPSTFNPPQTKPNQDVDKFGELMETALRFIVKAFDELGEAIKTNCKEARENLLKNSKNMEEETEKPKNEQGKQDNKQTSETPDNNILKPIFSALRSCIGGERKGKD